MSVSSLSLHFKGMDVVRSGLLDWARVAVCQHGLHLGVNILWSTSDSNCITNLKVNHPRTQAQLHTSAMTP
eukprot:6201351-Amphidinium_carterae.1